MTLEDDPSSSAGHMTATTPANPISSPVTCTRPGARRSSTAAIAAVASGIAPFSIPASDESIHCSAIEKHENGIAIHVAAMKRRRGSSRAGMCRRAAGKMPIASAPKAIRNIVTTDGAKSSSPIAMRRNEQPQINGGIANSTHSVGPKS